MIIPFHKYHALGNDYLVIDPNQTDVKMTEENIKRICHRHFGLGSDGILYGPEPEGEGMRLRIFNPDGSEAEKSGNGIRIFSRYLLEAGYVASSQFDLQTLGGWVKVEFLDAQGSAIKVDMGKVTFQSDQIPVTGPAREVVDEPIALAGREYRMTCLSIGNPHCVIPLDEISSELALDLGPLVENNIIFPNRINLQLLRVLDRRRIRIEIWERGAGYTMASGSSSCAAASAAFRLGQVDREIQVEMPGGTIAIEIKEDGHVFMTGSVTSVAHGEVAPDLEGELER